MYYPRRAFLKKMGQLGSTAVAAPLLHSQNQIVEVLSRFQHRTALENAKNEDYWDQVRSYFKVSKEFINLENGYYSLAAESVLNAQENHMRMINEIRSFYMRKKQWDDHKRVKQAMADFVGVSADEIVICRNTTEALNNIIMGLPLKAGDEAIMCNQDYGSMLSAFNQRARRDGIVNKVISLPLHPTSDQEIVDAYEKAVTPRTKVILVTHLINISGQVLPVRKIAEMAHGKGIEIIADAAHSVGQLDFKIPELDCDYLGSSLHKWVGAPLGAGLMYVRQDKIAKIWPLFGDDGYPEDDIRKLEHIGTHPCATDLSIIDALEFQYSIGIANKEARLKYLKKYWVDQLQDTPGIIINTPFEEARSSGIANVHLQEYRPSELADRLFDDFNIFTVAIDNEPVKGIRVTPHLYTKLEELDALVSALKQLNA